MTTRWHNVKGRAEFLMRVTERKNCEDLVEGEVLTDAQRYAYAICEELDDFQKRLDAKLTAFTDKIAKAGAK